MCCLRLFNILAVDDWIEHAFVPNSFQSTQVGDTLLEWTINSKWMLSCTLLSKEEIWWIEVLIILVLRFLVLKKPLLFKQGLDGKIAYDSQTKNDEPRGGEYVEHILGLEKELQLFINAWWCLVVVLILKCLNSNTLNNMNHNHYKI